MVQNFVNSESKHEDTIFAGARLNEMDPGLEISQHQYTRNIKIPPSDGYVNDYWLLRHNLSRLEHKRREIRSSDNMAAWVNERKFSKDEICCINTIARHLNGEDPQVPLSNHKLDLNTVRLKVYSYCSFANN